MITNYLTATDFYSYTGLTSADVNTSALSTIIARFNSMVSNKLSDIFTFSQKTKKYYMENSARTVVVGTWQKAGVIASVTVTNGGTGYSSSPKVTVTGNAELEAVVAGGVITAINIINAGSGYVTAPTITITDSTGTNATATCTISTLSISTGRDGTTGTELLTEGDDYRVLTAPDNDTTIIGLLLYSGFVSKTRYIEISGTYGYSGWVPYDIALDLYLYDMIRKVLLSNASETENGGKGIVTSAKMDKVSVSYATGYENGALTTKQALNNAKSYIDNLVQLYGFNDRDFISFIG